MIHVPGLPDLPDKFGDFRRVLYLIWTFLNLPAPTRVQLDIAYFLQHGPRRKIIEAFRGVGKSWITSAYVVWRLRMDPQLNFLVVSASKDRADNFSTFTLQLIYNMPVFQCMIPRTWQRESKISFDVSAAEPDQSPSSKSVGIFGQMTGSRAHEIIADDVEVANNSETQLKREKLGNAVKEFDAILLPGGKVTFLGTPQSEDTLYDVMPERGYVKRIWPARYPTPEQMIHYGQALAPLILVDIENGVEPGTPTDPARFNDTDLMEREASYGRSDFALQFMLDTSLSDANRFPLRLSDLIIYPLNNELAPQKIIWGADPRYMIQDVPNVGMRGDRYYGPAYVSDEYAQYTGCIMAIDPSGRGEDETTYAIVKMLNGYLFLVKQGGFSDGYTDEVLTSLATMAKEHDVKKIVIESNFGDGMFTKLLAPHLTRIYPCTCEEVRHNTQKERRIIDTLEPVMNQHRLVISPSVIEDDYESTQHLPPEQALKKQLFHQMTRLTKERGALAHDDRIDVLAIAVNAWLEAMGQDEDVKMEQRREQALLEELGAFHGNIGADLDMLMLRNELPGLPQARELPRPGVRGMVGFKRA